MTPLEMMKALHDIPEELIDLQDFNFCAEEDSEALTVIQMKNTEPPPEQRNLRTESNSSQKQFGITLLSYLLTAGCTAACIAGFALIIRFSGSNAGINTQSGTADSAVTEIAVTESTAAETTEVTTAPVSAGERAVLTVTAKQSTKTQTTARAEAAAAVTETVPAAETAAAETMGPAAETQTVAVTTAEATTVSTRAETEPPAPVYEMGDVDMDGQITFVDAALVHLDWLYACQFEFLPENNPDNPPEKEWLLTKWEHAPLTPEQRILGNVNGKDDKLRLYEADSPTFTLSEEDAEIIFQVAKLRNWHQMDVTFEEYIEQHEDYLEQFHEIKDHYVYEPRKEDYDLAFLREENISLEEWNQSLSDSILLYNDLASAGFAFRAYTGVIDNPLQFETEEEFYQHYYLVMTVEEFYEQAEVMKEKYFKNGWKRSLSDESN